MPVAIASSISDSTKVHQHDRYFGMNSGRSFYLEGGGGGYFNLG